MKRYQYIEEYQDPRGYGYPVIADYGDEGPRPGKHAIAAWAFFQDGERIVLRTFDPGDLLRWSDKSAVLEEFDDLDQALEYLATELAREARIAPVPEA